MLKWKMGRECNTIFRENSGLERLPLELAQSVDEIEGTEIASLRSAAFQLFHTRLRRKKPNQRYPNKVLINENEEKNEILSRTFAPSRRLCVFVYFALVALLLGSVMEVSAATVSLKPGGTLADDRRNGYQRPNKNCKEFDVTSRAYLADLIFEGTARSRSPSHGHSGRYEVTFVIQNILKQRTDAVRLMPKSQVRLHFGERGQRRQRFEHCSLRRVKSTSLVKANVKTGGTYFVFAHQLSPMNYTARGEPIVNNRRNRKSIQSVLSRNKERPPRVLGLQNVSRGVASPLRLSCQVRGLPVPRITWSKDGSILIPTSRRVITYYRRNSTIDIASVRPDDAGKYKCLATSVTGSSASVEAYVNVSNHVERTTRPSPEDWPMREEKCQVDTFCLNNGKCRFVSSIGEHICICEEGYTGSRCEHKDVSRDWFPSGLDEETMLPTLKKLYRRRIRGHPDLSMAEYKAVIRSIGDNKRFRHWLSQQGPFDPPTTTDEGLTPIY